MDTLDAVNEQDLTQDSDAKVPNVTSGAVSGLEHRSLGDGDPDQQGPANDHGDTDADHLGDLESSGHTFKPDGYISAEDSAQTPDVVAQRDRAPATDGHGDYGRDGGSVDVDATVDDVLAEVGDDQAKAQAALDAERAKPEDQQRSTLISGLQAKGAQ